MATPNREKPKEEEEEVYTIQQKNLYHYKLKFKFDLKINKSDFEQIVITLTFFSKIIIKQKLKQTLDLLPATFQ